MVFTCMGQDDINFQLKEKLDSILYKDQTLRELFDDNITSEWETKILVEFGIPKEDIKAKYWSVVAKQDSLNLIEIEEVILKLGYPGKTLVGEPTNEAAWYVIQHSDKIEQYFPIIEKAGEGGELPMRLVAMMGDRLLMQKGKEQIYGTQVAGRKINFQNKEKEEWFQFVWPIKNPEKVNELRKKAGFDLTVEENASRLNVEYHSYTLKEIDSTLNPK